MADPHVLYRLQANRDLPDLGAEAGDVLLVWSDGTTDVMHRAATNAEGLLSAMAREDVTLLPGPLGVEPPPAAVPLHRLLLVR